MMTAVALCALSPCAWAQMAPVAPPAIPSADLETVRSRGAQLYAYDQAAWHTTDALIAAKLAPDITRTIRGWVVEPVGDALRVTYYAVAGDRPAAVYIADYAGKAVRGAHVPASAGERVLTPLGQKMVAAHDAAFARGLRACADRPFNSVILPPDAQGRIPVYLLTPMVKAGAYPFGGHYEVDVDDAGQVAAIRPFSKSCLTVAAPPKAGASTAAAFVTHLLDPHPTEIHVYLSLWSGKPVYVGTSGTLWEVAGTGIVKVENKK